MTTVADLSCPPELEPQIRGFLQELVRPAKEEQIYVELQKLKYKTAARAHDQEDWKFKLKAYLEELSGYPLHAIIWACSEAAGGTFFPVASELKKSCERRVGFANRLLAALRPDNTQKIETIGHYREIRRENWKPAHFLQKATDLIGFANVHKREHHAKDELEYLLTAKLFIEECSGKFHGQEPELLALYRFAAEIKPRIEILEKRLEQPEEPQAATG